MTRRLEVACVLAIGVAFALAYGSPYGTNNQVTYLLDPLVRAFPELYHRDWFVADMHHYHFAFAYVTAPLYSLDPDGTVAFGIAQVVAMVATYAAIFALVAAVEVRARLTIFLGLVGLLVLGGGRTLGGGYLFAGYLQPSSLAAIAWLIAMTAWARDRMLVAGIALGIGAAFHLNYAVLGVGVFALAELCTRRPTVKRFAMLLGPSLVVLIVFLPAMIASSRASDGQHALDILVKFTFPIHFKPARIRTEIWALMGWLAIAWAMRPQTRGDARDRLWWFAVSGMALVLVTLLVVSIPPFLTLTRLFVWRIAPFAQLAGQIILVAGVYDIASRDAPRPTRWRLAALGTGAIAVIYNAFTRPRDLFPPTVTCVLVICAIAIVVRREWNVRALCIATCVWALWLERATLVAPYMFDTFEPPVTTWARASTPVDALFLVPPNHTKFRLHARRAIVVDTKSPPMYLDELVAWYSRLCTAVDADKLTALDEASEKYDALPPERLIAIARTFEAQYVLVQRQRSATRLPYPIAYEDEFDLVYALPPPTK